MSKEADYIKKYILFLYIISLDFRLSYFVHRLSVGIASSPLGSFNIADKSDKLRGQKSVRVNHHDLFPIHSPNLAGLCPIYQ